MLPSSTVENYLKAIFVGETHLVAGQKLVPMGQLASALGIAPGTATTMVKALSESGLVVYEPYNGVRLTSAGEKLAARVLRRHRLIELFLVQVMGMKWDEVHDDAEQMEHVVSDQLIERIDEMLGSPEFDPHGDPIPSADGQLAHRALETLLTCPLNTPVTVARVTDQDAAALHREPQPETGTDDRSRRTRRSVRQRAPERPQRSADDDRHARRVKAAGY
jgi:DtxR family Mn-dependent transcriptional regulator